MTDAHRFAWLLTGTLAVGCNGSGSKLTESQVDADRQACSFTAGMPAAATLPAGTPTGKQLPIDHIILIMQENRSFDHYYSELPMPGLNVASHDDSNTDSMGNVIKRFHFTTKCMGGGDHGWDPEHMNLDGGKLDNFVRTNGDSTTPMGYYDGTDLPFYYALAQSFAISDSHFSSALAPTWPNRMFYLAGTSFGLTDNEFPPAKDPQGNVYPNLLNALDAVNTSWNVYSMGNPTPAIVAIGSLVKHTDRDLDTANFVSDVQAGKLAAVTIVEGSDLRDANSPDEGPPGDVDVGQDFTSRVIDTVMQSPFWKSSAIFLTYDENGGMYDHVVPPAACPPDDLPANPGVGAFNQYGFRVPFFVISPYAKRGYVSHVVTDHTSILRFIEARFGMPAMTRRDANAAPPYDMFDFDHPNFSIPSLPTVTIDQDVLTACCTNHNADGTTSPDPACSMTNQ